MSNQSISRSAARLLRGGTMPHVPPDAAPLSARVRLEVEAPPDAYPEAVFTDPRREHGWRVALSWTDDRPPTTDDGQLSQGHWYADILLPQEPTVLTYYFVLRDGSTIRERRQ